MRPFCLIHRIGVHLSWLGVDFLRWPLCQGILLLDDDGFLSHSHSSEQIRCPFSHWSMRHDWYISSGVLYTEAYFSVDDGFWGIVVPWRWLDSFHIGAWDITKWFDWMCLYENIAISLVLMDFWVIGSWCTLVRVLLVPRHFEDRLTLGHSLLISVWS